MINLMRNKTFYEKTAVVRQRFVYEYSLIPTLLFLMPAPVNHSPDVDVFATPPTTPMTSDSDLIIRPSLSRVNSRPSNLHISQSTPEFRPDILLESQSPPIISPSKPSTQATTSQSLGGRVVDDSSATNGHSNGRFSDSDHSSRPEIPAITTIAIDTTLSSRTLETSPDPLASAPPPRSHTLSQNPITSPCFVHSNLNKGISFSEWLKTSNSFLPHIDVAPALQPDMPKASPRRYRKLDNGHIIPLPYEQDDLEPVFEASDYDYEDDDGNASLTKQLAETAVGVRELSRRLGAFGDPH
jgi:NAD+ kinase